PAAGATTVPSRALSQLQAGQTAAAIAEVTELTTAGANGTGLVPWIKLHDPDAACPRREKQAERAYVWQAHRVPPDRATASGSPAGIPASRRHRRRLAGRRRAAPGGYPRRLSRSRRAR